MSLFDNLLVNQHNIELFDKLNGSDIEVRDLSYTYNAQLESRIFEMDGAWFVIINALFKRDVHELPPFVNFIWEGSNKDTFIIPVSAHLVYVKGECLQDMVKENGS